MKKCFETNSDIYLALFQIRSTLPGFRLLSLATLLFNIPPGGLLPEFSRSLMLFDNDESNHAALIKKTAPC